MFRPIYLLLMLFSFLQSCFNFDLKPLWHAPVASSATPLIQNGTLYVIGIRAGHPEEASRIFALDALTGQEKWVSPDSVETLYGESGGSVFFRNSAKHLVQLDAQTGEVKYESPDADSPFLSWVLEGDVMFIINSSMEVVAVDNRQDKVLWKIQLPFEPYSQTNLQIAGERLIVNGNFKGAEQYGKIWALDKSSGKEIWTFEAPPPHDFAPLTVLAHEPYILATNTAPLSLKTHVLDARTGKELYPPIYAFDFRGCYEQTAHASGGAFDLKTGQRTGETASWIAGSAIYKGRAWKLKMAATGVADAFLLRTTYDGDLQGNRSWYNMPPNTSVEEIDIRSGKSVGHTKEYKYTLFSQPVEAGGILYHSSIAMMKEGTSGVWAYRLPDK